MGCTGQQNEQITDDCCQITGGRPDDAGVAEYQIVVMEHLSLAWEGWFEGMQLKHTGDGETIITGRTPDQSALHGILAKVRDLNLTLISLQRINSKAK